MSKPIFIVSTDGINIKTDSISCNASGLFRGLIEEYSSENTFTIPEIRGEILKLIIEFIEHIIFEPCIELPKPLPNCDLKDFLSKWEDDFFMRFDNDIKYLFEFINAANYLDIPCLLEISCAKAAVMAKDYDADKFSEVFQITKDMTDEDAKKIEEDFELEKKEERLKKLKDKYETEINKDLENNIDLNFD